MKDLTPKEKANELLSEMIDTYYITSDFCYNSTAKQCALIAVREILKSHNNLYGVNSKKTKYYLEVKQEIENYEH